MASPVTKYVLEQVSLLSDNKTMANLIKSASHSICINKLNIFLEMINTINLYKHNYDLIVFYHEDIPYAHTYWRNGDCMFVSIGKSYGNKYYEITDNFMLFDKLPSVKNNIAAEITYINHSKNKLPKSDGELILLGRKLLTLTQTEIHQSGISQKVYILTYGSIFRVGDISRAIWRDIFISAACSDLVLNIISPVFCMMGNWSFLDTIDIKESFIVPEIVHKYNMVHTYDFMCSELYKMYSMLNEEENDDSVIDVQDNIKEVVHNINTNLRLSDIITLSTIETYDIKTEINVSDKKSEINEIGGATKEGLFNTSHITLSDLFNIFYGIDMLHKKLGIINTKLTFKNIRWKKHECSILYLYNSKSYLINSRYIPAIYDFSDAYIGDGFVEYYRKYINICGIVENDINVLHKNICESLGKCNLSRRKIYDFMYSNMKHDLYLRGLDYLTLLNDLPQYEELRLLVKRLFIKNLNAALSGTPPTDIMPNIIHFFNKLEYNGNSPFTDIYSENNTIKYSVISSVHGPDIPGWKISEYNMLSTNMEVSNIIDRINIESLDI